MTAIDNLSIIAPLLTFRSEDDFYHLQIIKRKKEHPELGSNSYIVKTYYVQSVNYLFDKMPEIKYLCDYHNARAMINLNVRSFEKVAFRLLQKIAGQIASKDFRSCRKAYESVVGGNSDADEKRWIIDVDSDDKMHVVSVRAEVSLIEPLGDKCVALLPTKNGYHLIVRPFNVQKKTFTWDIHKDNPTMLYQPNHGNRKYEA